MNILLNSYYPISHTDFGRKAVINWGIHPLEDGSIRREPDFAHMFAPISGLCRPGALGHLQPGDVLVYKTNQTHILTAILKITRRFDSHHDAAKWLIENGYEIPSNNITANPLPLDHSHAHGYMKRVGKGIKLDAAIHNQWNQLYHERGTHPRSSYFFLTESIYNAVQSNLQPNDFFAIQDILRGGMGRIPNTNWRPEKISENVLSQIIKATEN